jgi:hypothetical protein
MLEIIKLLIVGKSTTIESATNRASEFIRFHPM